MGEAKRRAQFDPGWGLRHWTCTLYAEIGDFLSFDFTTTAQNWAAAGNGVAGLVVATLFDPDPLNWERLAEAIGPESAGALQELQPDVPPDFWLNLTSPDGVIDEWFYSSEEAIRLAGVNRDEIASILPADLHRAAVGIAHGVQA